MGRNVIAIYDTLELDSWIRPDTKQLKDEFQPRYENAVVALTAVLTGELGLTRAASDSALCKKRLKEMVRRAPLMAPDGHPYGFRVCVPWGAYHRDAEPEADVTMPTKGGPHALTQVLLAQPKIGLLVHEYSHPLPPGRPPKSFDRLHSKIVAELKRLDLSQFYPLNQDDEGRRALLRYLRQRKLDSAPLPSMDQSGPAPTVLWDIFQGRLFDRTEFDAHRIDVDSVFSIDLPKGGLATRLITSMWFLAEIEIQSRAIVAWQLRVGRSYNNLDVATCLSKSMQPWTRRELTIPGLEYAAGAGMPTGLQGALGALRSRCIALDNAMSHHSLDLEQAFCRGHDGALLFGHPHQPRSRPIIEQLYSRLEQSAFRLLPGGFEPAKRLGDEKNRISEHSSEEHPVQLHLLEELLDVLVANYNATAHPALGSISPLQFLQMRGSSNGWAYRPSDGEICAAEMGSVLIPVTIKGSYDDKIMPHVNYLYAKYRSTDLDAKWGLLGKKLYARVYRNDLRTMVLYETATKPIGVLRACSPWSLTRHDETTRRMVHQWSKQPGGLSLLGAECAIEAYVAFLRAKAASSQQAVDQLARMQQQQTKVGTQANAAALKETSTVRAPRRGWVSLDTTVSPV